MHIMYNLLLFQCDINEGSTDCLPFRTVLVIMDQCYATTKTEQLSLSVLEEEPAITHVSFKQSVQAKFSETECSALTNWLCDLLTSNFDMCKFPSEKGESVSCFACEQMLDEIADAGHSYIPLCILDHHKYHIKSYDFKTKDLAVIAPENGILAYYNPGGLEYRLFPIS